MLEISGCVRVAPVLPIEVARPERHLWRMIAESAFAKPGLSLRAQKTALGHATYWGSKAR